MSTIVDSPEDLELGFIERDGPADTVSKGLGKLVAASVEDGDSVPFPGSTGVGPEVIMSVIDGLGAGVVASTVDGLKDAGCKVVGYKTISCSDSRRDGSDVSELLSKVGSRVIACTAEGAGLPFTVVGNCVGDCSDIGKLISGMLSCAELCVGDSVVVAAKGGASGKSSP